MTIIIVGATVVGLIGYILLSDPKPKDRKIGGKASPILFKSSLRMGGANEKEVVKTLKEAGIEPCFLDAELKEKSNESTTQQGDFNAIVNTANQKAYEFMKNNTDSLGENSVKNILEDEYIFTHFPIVEEPHYVKVKSKKKK